MKASEFDKAFEKGKDLTKHLDIKNARRPNKKTKRVNVDFPSWMVDALAQEATRLGVTRQAVIKVWVADKIDKQTSC
ncbi:type II toxin-antitoxin system BrnA family antitoxin [Halodesulfovibrio spirochaetisodalis]|uniref:CopG family transcriptional regulator n=1 Tax=Halodesulfovibrio spirochaetisodalis TaxID=1560234 RepID=A0A1B7XQ36_9BACT|nr:CopG family transcriptional regulator [Halodesulfovibrio spirochaetisodalis]OBQ57634.1 CopG family transcriptional regulator [Halodesulfovibrio spirochaetisodalis]